MRAGRRLAVALLLSCVATSSSGSGVAERPFLTFGAAETLTREAVVVSVGLRNSPPRVTGHLPGPEHIWFSAQFDDAGPAASRDRRWTDGQRCPAAVQILRKVENLEMPRPRIPIEGGQSWGSSIRDGRGYHLDAERSNLQGQATGQIHIVSNVGTDLAKWVDAMLEALEPCWSNQPPAGLTTDEP